MNHPIITAIIVDRDRDDLEDGYVDGFLPIPSSSVLLLRMNGQRVLVDGRADTTRDDGMLEGHRDGRHSGT